MMVINKLNAYLLAGWVTNLLVSSVVAEEEVLFSGVSGVFLSNGSTNAMDAQRGNCRLILQGDGNFYIRRRIASLDDELDGFPTSWSTGVQPVNDLYSVVMTEGGNLNLVRSDGTVVWTTNVIDNPTAYHELVIDSACRLKLQHDGQDVWENIKIPPFRAGQVLQRGEMFRMAINIGKVPGISHGFTLHYVLNLQQDCNLVQWVGTDGADRKYLVWKTSTPKPTGTYCYLYLDKARVALYEGAFDNSLGFEANRPGQYWSTPASWFDRSLYSDEIQENYEILLDDASVFHWRSCDPVTCEPWPA